MAILPSPIEPNKPHIPRLKANTFGKFPEWPVKSGRWRELRPIAQAVFAVLVTHADNLTHESTLTIPEISYFSGVCRSSVPRAIYELREESMIERRRFGNRVKYLILREPPEWLAVSGIAWSTNQRPRGARSAFKRDLQNGRFAKKPRHP